MIDESPAAEEFKRGQRGKLDALLARNPSPVKPSEPQTPRAPVVVPSQNPGELAMLDKVFDDF